MTAPTPTAAGRDDAAERARPRVCRGVPLRASSMAGATVDAEYGNTCGPPSLRLALGDPLERRGVGRLLPADLVRRHHRFGPEHRTNGTAPFGHDCAQYPQPIPDRVQVAHAVQASAL